MVKRRLAFVIVALLLVVLIAIVVGDRDMGGCDYKYELITPDGQVFDLFGPGRAPGSAASLVAHEGFGLPPVSHVTQDVYDMPGTLLVDLNVESRTVTITESAYATDQTRKGLHKSLAAIWDAVRWDRGATDTEPTILRYTLNGNSWDLKVNLAGTVEAQQGRYGRNEIVGLRFIAHDPLWWDDAESSLTLDWQDEFTVRYCIGKEDGVWTPLGPPVAVAPGAGGGTDVFDTAIDPLTGDVYFGGDFRNWDNLAAPGLGGDHIVRRNVTSQAWEVVGNGLNERVTRLYFGPDGSLYVGGLFTNGSGGAGDPNADYLARYDRDADAFVNVGGGPGAGVGGGIGPTPIVYAIVIGHDGTLYIGGDFNDWSAAGNDFLVQWDAVGGWSLLGAVHPDSIVRDSALLLNGHLIVVGNFANVDGTPAAYIAEWDGAAWSEPDSGFNNNAYACAVGPDGILYVGGLFTQAGSAPTTVNYIASWNGVVWSDLDGGLDNIVWHIEIADNGEVWAGGDFTQAGSLTLTDHVARWNGFSWAHVGVDIPGAPAVDGISFYGDNVYFGFSTTGTAYVPGDNTVTDAGSALSYPTIEIKNAGLLQTIRNETTGEEMLFDMQILDGEIIEIDTTQGAKAITSTWRPLGRLGDLLPPGMGTFKLESGPRAQYGGVDGANLVTVFITDADPREHNDGGNQLSGWDGITGVSQQNTDAGILYASVVVVGGGFNRVDFYMDAARTDLVAHTDDYNGVGAVVINEDNASGLGGTVTVDAVGVGDVDIFVYYTVVTMNWYARWWSVDEAVIAA